MGLPHHAACEYTGSGHVLGAREMGRPGGGGREEGGAFTTCELGIQEELVVLAIFGDGLRLPSTKPRKIVELRSRTCQASSIQPCTLQPHARVNCRHLRGVVFISGIEEHCSLR